jgi:histidine ammonia-lyase
MITLDGELSVTDVVAVARDHERVELADGAVADMERTRTVVREIVEAEERRVYGVNTGYGKMKNVPVPKAQLETQQVNLLRSHDVTVGDRFPIEVIRAAMLVRANVLAQGHSGARVELVEALLALLNEGVHPVIRQGGNSDNAAGLANVGLVLIGEGEAIVDGEEVSGEPALRRRGLDPLTLRAKEGVSLISGTAVVTALLSLAVFDVETHLDTADVAGAWIFDLIGKEPSAFDPAIAEVHQQPGQARVAANVRALVDTQPTNRDMSQDPLSIRCIPQIHGTARQFLDVARRTVETELDSVTDNPVVFPDGRVRSNGNFNGQHVATAADALGRILLKLGWASEQRFARLLEGSAGLPEQLTEHAGLEMGPSRLQYAAASLVTEAATTGPAGAHSFVTASGQEDVHAAGNIAGIGLRDILETMRHVVAAEMLAAAHATQYVDSVSPRIERIQETLQTAVTVEQADTPWAPRVEETAAFLHSAEFRQVLDEVLPNTAGSVALRE